MRYCKPRYWSTSGCSGVPPREREIGQVSKLGQRRDHQAESYWRKKTLARMFDRVAGTSSTKPGQRSSISAVNHEGSEPSLSITDRAQKHKLLPANVLLPNFVQELPGNTAGFLLSACACCWILKAASQGLDPFPFSYVSSREPKPEPPRWLKERAPTV